MLAGANGAGKSSVAGTILRAHGLTWFNPDTFSRELIKRAGSSKESADSAAWAYGKAKLEEAVAGKSSFAFETTLGGRTIPRLLDAAAETHDVIVIFCGLATVQKHIDRVKLRVEYGGHSIPERRIRERWDHSRQNLIALLPRLAHLQVFDNSEEASPGKDVPYPILVLEMRHGQVLYPVCDDVKALEAIPDWAKPIIAAAFRCGGDVRAC